MGREKLSSYAEFWASIDPVERRIIEQYQAIAGAHEALWQAIYLRTTTKAWERDPKGLGSCAITDDEALEGLDGPIRDEIINLRNRRSNETSLNDKSVGCPHHRPNFGCVLGDLKGPYCLDYIDMYMDDEIEERFGICLMPVKPYLDRVGKGVNDDFTAKTVAAINQVREYTETFPVLASKHLPDSSKPQQYLL